MASCSVCCSNFYPRSPRGERRAITGLQKELDGISIHAPRVGSDGTAAPFAMGTMRFLSTLPAWGATVEIY